MGFKAVNASAIDLLTGKSINYQSRNLCWPSRIVMCRETKKIHTDHINHVCRWWDGCKIIDDNGNVLTQNFPSMKPFDSCYPSDMSASWKLTKKGGGSKNKRMFCHCCDTCSENMHTPNDIMCDSFTELKSNDPEHENKLSFYCKEMMAEKHRKVTQDECDDVMKNIDAFSEDVRKSSKLKLIKNNMSEAKSDPHSIDFDPQTQSEKLSFFNFLLE